MSEIDPARIIESSKHRIALEREHIGKLILDIGGGGEGIIGKLYGRNVVAIDPRLDELEETENDSIKIVMDGCDLKFTRGLFDAATSFFTLMYMSTQDKVRAVFEIRRVLKPGGVFEIWDTVVPALDGGEKDVFILHLDVELPSETISTGYGVGMNNEGQSIDGIVEILKEAGFSIEESTESADGIFRIRCVS